MGPVRDLYTGAENDVDELPWKTKDRFKTEPRCSQTSVLAFYVIDITHIPFPVMSLGDAVTPFNNEGNTAIPQPRQLTMRIPFTYLQCPLYSIIHSLYRRPNPGLCKTRLVEGPSRDAVAGKPPAPMDRPQIVPLHLGFIVRLRTEPAATGLHFKFDFPRFDPGSTIVPCLSCTVLPGAMPCHAISVRTLPTPSA